jgi:5-methyltetrahydrofolate--homocysteine methyltransferase
MFLPQVVKSARVMKKSPSPISCRSWKKRSSPSGADARPRGKILLATVKGDVHDIGKNIVGVVLACNNYQIIDLGVMVPCRSPPAGRRGPQGVNIIGLSGLITPSLDEMVYVASGDERRKILRAAA